MSANASAPAMWMRAEFIGLPLDATTHRPHEALPVKRNFGTASVMSSSVSQRQCIAFRQRLSLRLRQERHGDQPKNVEQADNRRRFAIAAQADDQGAGDQWSDRGDQS